MRSESMTQQLVGRVPCCIREFSPRYRKGLLLSGSVLCLCVSLSMINESVQAWAFQRVYSSLKDLINTHILFLWMLSSWSLSWDIRFKRWERAKKDLLGGMDCMIFSALFLSSTFKVNRYLGVLNLNLVVLVFLFFLMVILSAFGRCFCSLLMILMNSLRSFISFG